MEVVMAEDWLEDVKKYATNVDEAAVAGIVRYLGIALRNRDSSLVSFSDKTETDYVRENYLKKKLGLTDPDPTLDTAIAGVGERMKEDRTKNRVTVYYLLAEHFGKLGLFNGGGTATATPDPEPSGIGSGVAGAAAAGAAGLAALGGATEAASASGVDEPAPIAGGAGTGGTRPLADLPDDGDGGSIFGKWWLWLLIALAIIAAFLLLKSCMQPAPVEGPNVVNAIDTNLSDDQSGNLSDSDIGNTTAAVPAAPAPTGAGFVTETRAGLPVLTTYFDTGKADLASGFADKAADVKAYLAAHPGAKLAVSGYNDPTGDAAVNAALSKKRAQAVAAALKAAGVAEDAVVLEKPADTTIVGSDNSAARRVEVTVKQ
jgi:outer membrane protein OmpA-like peptidoglycan-associated protein